MELPEASQQERRRREQRRGGEGRGGKGREGEEGRGGEGGEERRGEGRGEERSEEARVASSVPHPIPPPTSPSSCARGGSAHRSERGRLQRAHRVRAQPAVGAADAPPRGRGRRRREGAPVLPASHRGSAWARAGAACRECSSLHLAEPPLTAGARAGRRVGGRPDAALGRRGGGCGCGGGGEPRQRVLLESPLWRRVGAGAGANPSRPTLPLPPSLPPSFRPPHFPPSTCPSLPPPACPSTCLPLHLHAPVQARLTSTFSERRAFFASDDELLDLVRAGGASLRRIPCSCEQRLFTPPRAVNRRVPPPDPLHRRAGRQRHHLPAVDGVRASRGVAGDGAACRAGRRPLALRLGPHGRAAAGDRRDPRSEAQRTRRRRPIAS